MIKVEESNNQKSGKVSIYFVCNGKEFDIPIIKVSDMRAMQLKRSDTKDAQLTELEGSLTLVHSLLTKIDKSVTLEAIEDWDYSEFIKFVKILWEKNAENFRGIFPNLPVMTPKQKK